MCNEYRRSVAEMADLYELVAAKAVDPPGDMASLQWVLDFHKLRVRGFRVFMAEPMEERAFLSGQSANNAEGDD